MDFSWVSDCPVLVALTAPWPCSRGDHPHRAGDRTDGLLHIMPRADATLDILRSYWTQSELGKAEGVVIRLRVSWLSSGPAISPI